MHPPSNVADDRLLVLDEMDHLVTKNLDVLYKLIEYANRPGSRLVLIGIANSLNLPDRFLPRLKAKGLEPRQLSFNPYTTKQIVEIVRSRRARAGSDPLPGCDPPVLPGRFEITPVPELALCSEGANLREAS